MMIAMLLTALFAFAGLLSVAVLAGSIQRHLPAFLAVGQSTQRRMTREFRFTLIATEVRPLPSGLRNSIGRGGFSHPKQLPLLAA